MAVVPTISCKCFFPAVVAVVCILVGYLARFSVLSGTLPLLNIGNEIGFREEQLPDLSGLVMLVTGGNAGLGKATASLLARKGAKVLITCRTEKKCKTAKAEILESSSAPIAHLECFVVELSSLASVKSFVGTVEPHLKRLGGLHSLILNAGVMSHPYTLTEDGIEWHFAVNHLSHFMIAHELQDILVASAPSTVVSVSSIAHILPILVRKVGTLADIQLLNSGDEYDPRLAYGFSKLANIMFAREFNKRMSGEQVYANAVHPGAVRSNLTKYELQRLSFGFKWVEQLLRRIYDGFAWHEHTAALSVAFLAASEAVLNGHVQGKYIVPIGRVRSLWDGAINDTVQRDLWALSERLVTTVREIKEDKK